jgi:hemerythrin-like domain-containing protein
MDFSRQTVRLLHEEHQANLALLMRVGLTLPRAMRHDAGARGLLAALERQLAHEVGRHFEFEERELFGRMTDGGEGDLATLLAEEHATIRAVVADFAPLARAVDTASDADWNTLRRLALELVERLSAHIEKEEATFPPLLEQLLDADTDAALALAYASA